MKNPKKETDQNEPTNHTRNNNGRYDIKKIDMFSKKISLTFEGQERFRTVCGALATILLVLILLVISVYSVLDIYQGKLSSLNYIIKSREKQTQPLKKGAGLVFKPEQVTAVALEDYRLYNSSIMEILSFVKKSKTEPTSIGVYECTDYIYNRLSSRVVNQVPRNLTILCSRAPMAEINNGAVQRFTLSECKETPKEAKLRSNGFPKQPKSDKKSTKKLKKNSKNFTKKTTKCRPREQLDDLLEEYNVWVFAESDENNFNRHSKGTETKFTAQRTVASNQYKKRYTVVLRDVHVHLKYGLVTSKHWSELTKIYLRDENDIVSNEPEEVMLEVDIKTDMDSIVYIEKIYKSIFDAISFIGGLSKGLGVLFAGMVFPFREILYYSKLINSMFSVCSTPSQVETALELISEQLMQNDAVKKDVELRNLECRRVEGGEGGGSKNWSRGSSRRRTGGSGALRDGLESDKRWLDPDSSPNGYDNLVKTRLTFNSIRTLMGGDRGRKKTLCSLGKKETGGMMGRIIERKYEDSSEDESQGDEEESDEDGSFSDYRCGDEGAPGNQFRRLHAGGERRRSPRGRFGEDVSAKRSRELDGAFSSFLDRQLQNENHRGYRDGGSSSRDDLSHLKEVSLMKGSGPRNHWNRGSHAEIANQGYWGGDPYQPYQGYMQNSYFSSSRWSDADNPSAFRQGHRISPSMTPKSQSQSEVPPVYPQYYHEAQKHSKKALNQSGVFFPRNRTSRQTRTKSIASPSKHTLKGLNRLKIRSFNEGFAANRLSKQRELFEYKGTGVFGGGVPGLGSVNEVNESLEVDTEYRSSVKLEPVGAGEGVICRRPTFGASSVFKTSGPNGSLEKPEGRQVGGLFRQDRINCSIEGSEEEISGNLVLGDFGQNKRKSEYLEVGSGGNDGHQKTHNDGNRPRRRSNNKNPTFGPSDCSINEENLGSKKSQSDHASSSSELKSDPNHAQESPKGQKQKLDEGFKISENRSLKLIHSTSLHRRIYEEESESVSEPSKVDVNPILETKQIKLKSKLEEGGWRSNQGRRYCLKVENDLNSRISDAGGGDPGDPKIDSQKKLGKQRSSKDDEETSSTHKKESIGSQIPKKVKKMDERGSPFFDQKTAEKAKTEHKMGNSSQSGAKEVQELPEKPKKSTKIFNINLVEMEQKSPTSKQERQKRRRKSSSPSMSSLQASDHHPNPKNQLKIPKNPNIAKSPKNHPITSTPHSFRNLEKKNSNKSQKTSNSSLNRRKKKIKSIKIPISSSQQIFNKKPPETPKKGTDGENANTPGSERVDKNPTFPGRKHFSKFQKSPPMPPQPQNPQKTPPTDSGPALRRRKTPLKFRDDKDELIFEKSGNDYKIMQGLNYLVKGVSKGVQGVKSGFNKMTRFAVGSVILDEGDKGHHVRRRGSQRQVKRSSVRKRKKEIKDKQIEQIKYQNRRQFEQSKMLKFRVSFYEFLKLVFSRFFCSSSKADLFHEVSLLRFIMVELCFL